MSVDQPLLRIRDATVKRGSQAPRAVLHALDLEIHAGEHTAILGPNGAGKSTLLRLITNEQRALARLDGEAAVEIFGRRRWDVFELRRLLGVVSSDVQYTFTDLAAPSLTGLDVVVSAFFAARGVPPREQATAGMVERAHAVLDQIGAAHLSAKPMTEMSTGEARRVMIARALAPDPPALLLDEPTAGLDVVARHGFLAGIRRLMRTGKTVILITHQLEEVVPEIERVVLLRDGTVYCDGSKLTVLTDAKLSAAYGASLRVHADPHGYYRMEVESNGSMPHSG